MPLRVVIAALLLASCAVAQMQPRDTLHISPPDGAVLFVPQIQMGITVWDKRFAATVTVNGLAAAFAGNNFWRCPLSLTPGTNRFTVVAQFADQSSATSQVTYLHRTSQMNGDTIPPLILSVWPPDGTITTNPALAVRLRVVDNHAVASVSVNQQPASALPSNIWLATVPLQPGSNPALVIAEDVAGNAVSQLLSYVRLLPPRIVSTAAPPAVLDAPYSLRLVAQGGAPPLFWTVSDLPPGLALSNDWIVGVPAMTGRFDVTATVHDALGYADRSVLSILVRSPLHILTSQLPDAYVAQPYAFRLLADGGENPVSWSAASVPAGLSMLDNGQIYGTPSSTGKFELIITVTDSRGRSITKPLPIFIKEASDYLLLSSSGGALPEVPAGDTCTLALPVTTAPSALNASCPVPGVSISPAGLLHGTPAPGSHAFSFDTHTWVWNAPPRDNDSLGAFAVARITLSSNGTSGSLRLCAFSPVPPGLRLHASLPVVLSLGGFTLASTSACACSPQRYRAVFPLEGGSASLSISLTPDKQLAWSLSLRRIPHLAARITRFTPAEAPTRTIHATVLLGPHSAHTTLPLP